MPMRLEALTERETDKIFSWIVNNELQEGDDVFARRDGRFFLASRPIRDAGSGDRIGKYVFTFSAPDGDGPVELIDLDLVLSGGAPTALTFEKRLPASSDANEYYEVFTAGTEQCLIVETVDRHAADGEIEGTTRPVRLSAFPFRLRVFEDRTAYDRAMGFEAPVEIADPGIRVGGLDVTFLCPGGAASSPDAEEEALWSVAAGEIVSLREVTIAFGGIARDAVLAVLRTGVGELPALVGKETFDTAALAVGRIALMHACIKADFVGDRYPDPDAR